MRCLRAVLLNVTLVFIMGCATPAGPATTDQPAVASPPTIALRSDGRLAELRWEATDGEVVVDREHAVVAARAGVPAGAAAEASLAWLSVRGSDDGVLTLDRRKVWLVVFPDAAFAAGDACACEGVPSRPGTLVAVDAGDGSVLASFGVTRFA
jgi:hypothetical protein